MPDPNLAPSEPQPDDPTTLTDAVMQARRKDLAQPKPKTTGNLLDILFQRRKEQEDAYKEAQQEER